MTHGIKLTAKKISLIEAVKFHGHLGPYLILGLLAGESALKKLNCEKYFGLEVEVTGAGKKPKSCLIDGLQLSTGATFGKGNIKKIEGPQIRIMVSSLTHKKHVRLKLKKELIKKLESLKTHADSEKFAKELFKKNPVSLFSIETTS